MRIYCSRCGHPADVSVGTTAGVIFCTNCGAEIPLTSGGRFPANVAANLALRRKRAFSQDTALKLFAVAMLVVLLALLIRPQLVPGGDSRSGRGVRSIVFGKKTLDLVSRGVTDRAQGDGGSGAESGAANSRASRGRSGSSTGGRDGTAQAPRDGDDERENPDGSHSGERRADRGDRGGRERFLGPVPPANPNSPQSQPPGSALDGDNPPARSIGRIPVFGETNAVHAGIRHGIAGPDQTNAAGAGADATSERRADGSETGGDVGDASTDLDLPPRSITRSNRTSVTGQSRSATNEVMLSDDFTNRLQRAGARSGDVQVSLMWNNVNDLDLHCVDPRGEEIYFQHRRSASGGLLDIDMNAAPPLRAQPVENIYWPERGAPPGTYVVYVNHYRNWGGRDPTPFTVRVWVKGQSSYYSGAISFRQPKRRVCTFVVPAN